MMLTDEQYLRYNKHILLKDIGEQGQINITKWHAIIIGLGGLGCPLSQYLTASGIGKITLIDFDIIELGNLQRQILYTTEDIKKFKVHVAKKKLHQLNPNVKIHAITKPIQQVDLPSLLSNDTIIIDCSDNIKSKQYSNAFCRQHKIPFIIGSAINMTGQIMSFNFMNNASPCYQCIYPFKEDKQQYNCQNSGVLSPLLGIIGSYLAAYVLQIICNQHIFNELLQIDCLSLQQLKVKIQRSSQCYHQ